MPFKSKAQQRFLHAHPEKVGGAGKLKEWDDSTDFSSLPNKVAKKPKKWMGAESKREESAGTKGTFSAAAERAGQSTRDFAEEKKHAAGKTGKRARMALMYMGAKH
jgi:hypothetical protein